MARHFRIQKESSERRSIVFQEGIISLRISVILFEWLLPLLTNIKMYNYLKN
jgi:hypothetical protein